MKKQIQTSMLLIAVLAFAVMAEPKVTSVASIGKGVAADQPGGEIAQGSVFQVAGIFFEGGDPVVSELPLGTEVAGVKVIFTAEDGTAVEAFIQEVRVNRITGILPSTAAAGKYKIKVTVNGEASKELAAVVVQRNPGIVTTGRTGAGQASAKMIVPDADPVVNGFTKPARPGQQIVLAVTGLGPITGADNELPTEENLLPLKVAIGSKEVDATFAGRDGVSPGMDKVTFTLPEDVEVGCGVPVLLKWDGGESNSAGLTIEKPDKAACTHPWGLSEDTLRRLDEGGTVGVGFFFLARIGIQTTAAGITIDSSSESFGGSFERLTVSQLPTTSLYDAPLNITTIGNCSVISVFTQQTDTPVEVVDDPSLDAGPELTLTGPNGLNKAIPRQKGNSYSASLGTSTGLPSIPGLPTIPGLPGLPGASGPLVVAGDYRLTGRGGNDVGPFTANLTVGQPLTWTNRDQITAIDRSRPLTVTWSGGTGSDTISLSGTSINVDVASKTSRGDYFWCTGYVRDGSLTVPTGILQRLQPTTGSIETGSIGTLTLNTSTTPPNGQFKAPLVAGGEVEYAIFGFTQGAQKTLPVR